MLATQAFPIFIIGTVFSQSMAMVLPSTSIPEWMEESFGSHEFMAQGVSSAVSGLLSFLMTPVIGALADRYGRKPFLMATLIVQAIPTVALLWSSNMWYYVIANALSGLCDCIFAISFAYISDCCDPAKRSIYFAWVMASFGASFTIGPFISGEISERVGSIWNVWLSLGVSFLGVMYTILILPESNKTRADKIVWSKMNAFKAFGILSQSKLTMLLALIVFFGNVSESGVMHVVVLYLGGEFGMDPQTLGIFLSLLGACTVFGQIVLLPILRKFFSDRRVVSIAYFANTVHCFIYGIATLNWHVFCNLILTGIAELSFVSVSAIVSHQVENQHRGAALGAISGVRSFTNGFGPILFGVLFDQHDKLGPFSKLPGFAFIVGAVFVVVAFIISLTLPQGEMHIDEEQTDFIINTDVDEKEALLPGAGKESLFKGAHC